MSNRIGNYDLIQELGRGPHGPVHLAVDTIRDRMVAIKRMQSLAGLGAEHRADLEDAFRRIAEMEAPNAGNAYAISPAAESVPYVVRAHINGLTLTQLRTHLRSMGDTFAVGLLYELARSLAAYHRRTRAHGNLKPNNVFLLKSGEVRLVDAAFAGPLLVAHCKPTEGVLGDPRFAPAEQLTHGHCMPAGDLHAMRALAGFLDDANPNEASAAGVAITTTATSAEAIVESLAAWLTERRTSAKDVLFEAAQLVGYAFLMADVERPATDAPKLAAPPARRKGPQTLTPPKDYKQEPAYDLGAKANIEDRPPVAAPSRAMTDISPPAGVVPEILEIAEEYNPRDIGEITSDPKKSPVVMIAVAIAVIVAGIFVWQYVSAPKPTETAPGPSKPAPKIPLTPEQLLARARASISGPAELAAQHAREAADAQPDSLEAQKLLFAALLRAEQPTDASVAIQAAIRLAPQDVALRRLLAETYLDQKFGKAAAAAARDALLQHGSDASLHLLVARGELFEHRYERALKALETATQLAPQDAEGWFLLGETLRQQGDYGSAKTAYEKAIRYQPRMGPAYSGLGQSLLKLGKGGEAAQILAGGLRLVPDSPDIQYSVGRIMLHDGRDSEAQTHLERYVEARPDDWRGTFSLGLALLRLGKDNLAISQFRKAATTEPKSSELQYNLAMAHIRTGAHKPALAALDAAIESKRTLWLAHCEKGRVLMRLGEADEARRAFKQAVSLHADGALASRLADPDVSPTDAALLIGLPCGPPDLDISD